MFWYEREQWLKEVCLDGEKRRIGTKNLTQAMIWLLNHDWSLLVNKNMYMIFDIDRETWSLKLDVPVHICHYKRGALLEPWEFMDCEEGSVWDLIYRLSEKSSMHNLNYMHFVKDNKMIIINCGNNSIRFIGNNIVKLYDGDQIRIAENGIFVTSRPEDIKACLIRIKPNAKVLTKEKLQRVPLSKVWIKELRRFGE